MVNLLDLPMTLQTKQNQSTKVRTLDFAETLFLDVRFVGKMRWRTVIIIDVVHKNWKSTMPRTKFPMPSEAAHWSK